MTNYKYVALLTDAPGGLTTSQGMWSADDFNSIGASAKSLEPRSFVDLPTRSKFKGNPVVRGNTCSSHYSCRRVDSFRKASTVIGTFVAVVSYQHRT